MATDQPDKDRTPGKASNVLVMMFPDPKHVGCSFPNSRSIFVSHLPTNVDEEGNIKILKNGYWKTAGECNNCGDHGPCYSHCIRCNPLGFLYLGKEIELERIEIINNDPRSEGRMAHIVHSDILNQPDPAAAREQFLLFFPQLRDGWLNLLGPITSMIAPEKAMGKHKMRTAARLMLSQTHFLLLLDSYWADRKPDTE
jgi:hypothetical protein